MIILKDSQLPPETEEIAYRIIGCAIDVHRALGPGFKEKIYTEALCLELDRVGIAFEREKPLIVRYRQWEIPGQRVDLIVANSIIVELKAVRKLKDLHRRQVLSYLKAAEMRLGLLLNFNVAVLRNGIKRVIL